MSDYCHVSAQVAINSDEPEAPECTECGSQMTESDDGQSLVCDNINCKWSSSDE